MVVRGKVETRATRERQGADDARSPNWSELEPLLPTDWQAMIGRDPHRPGPDRWRLLEESIPVWAIISSFGEVESGGLRTEIDRVATDFGISSAAVAASVAYYIEHREAIDTRLEINADAVS
jgi:hypothetical protein